MPAPSQGLGIKGHLLHFLPPGVGIGAETNMGFGIIGRADVARKYQLDIAGGLHQLLPDGSAVITFLYRVGLLDDVFIFGVQVRVGEHDNLMVLVFFLLQHGQLDMVVHRKEMRGTLAKLVEMHTAQEGVEAWLASSPLKSL